MAVQFREWKEEVVLQDEGIHNTVHDRLAASSLFLLYSHNSNLLHGRGGFSLTITILSPPFISVAWPKGGLCLAFPILFPPFIPFPRVKGGHSRLSPYNYVNKNSQIIHSLNQYFLTKKQIEKRNKDDSLIV